MFTAYHAAQLLEIFRALRGIFLPAIEPGLLMTAAGALLLISTLFILLRG